MNMAFISYIFDEHCKANNRRFIIRIDGGHTSTITESQVISIQPGKHQLQINTMTDFERAAARINQRSAAQSDSMVGKAFYGSLGNEGEEWTIPFELGEDDVLNLYFPDTVGKDPTYQTVTLDADGLRKHMEAIQVQKALRDADSEAMGQNAVKALLFWLFLGFLGIHRRCLNRKWSIWYPLTLGCLGIVTFIDLFTMIIPAFAARNKH